MLGFGKRSNSPSSIIARAPAAVSSPGWNTAITVPRQVSRVCARDVRRTGEPRRMHVMAARMHDRYGVAFTIGRGDLARIGQAGRLGDRQRVHVGTQHHNRAFAVTQYPHDARLADTGRHFVARVAQSLRRDARCARFLHRQLGVGVNVLVQISRGRAAVRRVRRMTHRPTNATGSRMPAR